MWQRKAAARLTGMEWLNREAVEGTLQETNSLWFGTQSRHKNKFRSKESSFEQRATEIVAVNRRRCGGAVGTNIQTYGCGFKTHHAH